MAILDLRKEGLYCPDGDFYIDPWRPVPRAIITHGHADHARSGNEEYIATPATIAIMQHRLGEIQSIPWEYGGQHSLGRARVSLHPAGHVLGSAQVRIEVGGEVAVITGDFKRTPDPTSEPFESVPCDIFVTEATFALPVYHWRDTRTVVGDIYAWWQSCRAQGKTAVLACYALGKAQRVLAELLHYTQEPVYLHGAVHNITEIYRRFDVKMVPTQLVTEAKELAGQLVIAPPSATGASWMKRFKKVEVGFCSGWMQIRGNRRRKGYERGFVISDHADWPELLSAIRDCGAKQIYPTHGNTDAIVKYLNEQDISAQALETAFGEEDD